MMMDVHFVHLLNCLNTEQKPESRSISRTDGPQTSTAKVTGDLTEHAGEHITTSIIVTKEHPAPRLKVPKCR